MALPSVRGFGLRDSEPHGLPVHEIHDMANADIPMATPLVGIFPSAIPNGLNTMHLLVDPTADGYLCEHPTVHNLLGSHLGNPVITSLLLRQI
jgi:hypothetical protein